MDEGVVSYYTAFHLKGESMCVQQGGLHDEVVFDPSGAAVGEHLGVHHLRLDRLHRVRQHLQKLHLAHHRAFH